MKTRWNMTMRERVAVSAAALAMTFAAGVVYADNHEDEHTVPSEVGFSGWLGDEKGEAITGEVDLVVGVFDAATGGEQVGTFTLPGVEVDRGRFSITLNSDDGEIWDGSTRWVEVSVDGDTLSPRTAIVSTPYALRAGVATKLTDAARADVLADAEARIAALEAKLASVTVSENGQDVYFTGVNVHVRDGSGSTLGVGGLPGEADEFDARQIPIPGTGRGNLIVGYNEDIEGPEAKSGQHNLVVGVGHSYRGAGGIVSGYNNEFQGHTGALIGGWRNTTGTGAGGSVAIGGANNDAVSNGAVAVGGQDNTAESKRAVSIGGNENENNGEDAVIIGGLQNGIEEGGEEGKGSVVIGGVDNQIAQASNTEVENAVIVGGMGNTIDGLSKNAADRSVIVGGEDNQTHSEDAVVVGGKDNSAEAKGAVQISGEAATNTAINTGNVATP